MLEYFYTLNTDKNKEIKLKIMIGENAEDNWKTLDLANQNDILLHLDKFSSPYVIITDIPKKYIVINDIIKYAAELCKEHSKYKNQDNISVMYTNIKNVTKVKDTVGSIYVKKKQVIN